MYIKVFTTDITIINPKTKYLKTFSEVNFKINFPKYVPRILNNY